MFSFFMQVKRLLPCIVVMLHGNAIFCFLICLIFMFNCLKVLKVGKFYNLYLSPLFLLIKYKKIRLPVV